MYTFNLRLDLLHNFFLKCRARANKIRVDKIAKEPTARAFTDFLPVRGGVHIVAYAKALEKLSGVAVGKLLPIPDIGNNRLPEAKRYEDAGLHRILYRFSPEDYARAREVWNGLDQEDGGALEVVEGTPEGVVPPDIEAEPQLTSFVGPDESDLDPEIIEKYSKRIFGKGIGDEIKRRKSVEPVRASKSKRR